mmetsp:Transcript_79609/g.153884  ORF Transcript_79609/g.153884 Transcript_79609/m.153884 type:complete len:333 (-) Transcript_79609:347-1345(-)
MYSFLLALSVVAPVVDSAVCTALCSGFVQGDCRCHDAGPWAMWICTRKGGVVQAQPWFCSQPTCGCNGGSNPSTPATHAGKANASAIQAEVAGASLAPQAAVQASPAPVPQVAVSVPVVRAEAARAASPTPGGTPQLPAITAPPTIAATASPTKAAPQAPRQPDTNIMRGVGQLRQSSKGRLPAGVRFPCAPLPTPSHRFLVHECAWVDPGSPCLVHCNASAGWHGASAIFWCPARNTDASQMAVAWATWPNCTRSMKKGSTHLNSFDLKHVQRSFLESSLHLRQPMHSPTAVLLGVAVFAAMVSLISLCRSSKSQQTEAQHFLCTTLENQE